MPSTRTIALALAAMVLLSGCSMLPGAGGGNDAASREDAPDYHGFTLVSDTNGAAFDATVTVAKDGEQLLERSISSDGTGKYVNLSSVTEPGPYTVTVNTTIPAAGDGNTSDRVRVNGTLGNETLVDVSYTGISFDSFRLPREEMSEPLRFRKRIQMPIESTIVVKHHGEVLYSETVHRNGTGPFELADLPETGVYRVAVSGPNKQSWANETVILREPGEKLYAELDADDPRIRVYGPNEEPPRW